MLKTFDLSYNNLTTIPSDLGRQNEKIRRIYMNDNKLEKVPTHLIYSPEIISIDLKDNELKEIEETETKNFSKVWGRFDKAFQ